MKFLPVSWTSQDVKDSAREHYNLELTESEAESWLFDHAHEISNRLTSLGHEVIASLLIDLALERGM